MAITLDRQGQRIYFGGDTYAAKDRIKAFGAHWDGERRAWWIGAKKLAEAEALVAELNAPSEVAQQAAASVGLRPDTPTGIVADALDDAGKGAEAAALRHPPRLKQDPADIRLSGKGIYKGRNYYIGATTKDGARCRLLTLPNAAGDYLDFWADVSAVQVTKTYQPRQTWDGRRYSGRTRTVYTTLGSIAAFVARQRDPETARGQCSECGEYGPRGQTCEECHEGTHC